MVLGRRHRLLEAVLINHHHHAIGPPVGRERSDRRIKDVSLSGVGYID